MPSPPNGFFYVAPDISVAKSFPSTAAHNRPYTVFHPIKGTGTTHPAGGAHKPSQGLTRAIAVLGCSARCRRGSLAENESAKICRLFLDFPNLLGTFSLQQRILL